MSGRPLKYFLSDEELKELEHRRSSGETYTAIARDNEIPESSLRSILVRSRLKRNKQPQTVFLKLTKPYKHGPTSRRSIAARRKK